jgi:hypothetical protein
MTTEWVVQHPDRRVVDVVDDVEDLGRRIEVMAAMVDPVADRPKSRQGVTQVDGEGPTDRVQLRSDQHGS